MRDMKISGYDFSFILPFQNDAAFIKDCLNSLSAGKTDGVEVLCINLNSTDETAQIIAETAEKYPFVRLAGNAENINQALNLGLSSAQGKYIKFINARLVFHRFATELMFKMMEHEQTNVMLHSKTRLTAEGDVLSEPVDKWLKKFVSPAAVDEIFEHLLNITDMLNAVAFRRSFITENGMWFDESRRYPDIRPLLNNIIRSEKISLIFEDIVQQAHPEIPVCGNAEDYLNDMLRLRTDVHSYTNEFLPMYKVKTAEYILSELAHRYKLCPADERTKFAQTVKNEFLPSVRENLADMSDEVGYNYGVFLTGSHQIKVSVVFVCETIDETVKQYLRHFIQLKNMYAELLIICSGDRQSDEEADDLSCVSDFVRIYYGKSVTDIVQNEAKGDYILFQNVHSICFENLWPLMSFASESKADMLFNVMDSGVYKSVSREDITGYYLKYGKQKFHFKDIYANLIEDILYRDTQIFYKREYLIDLFPKYSFVSADTETVLPLTALLNSAALTIYPEFISAYKKDELTAGRSELAEKVFYRLTGQSLAELAEYEQILYRFRVPSEERFAEKLRELNEQYEPDMSFSPKLKSMAAEYAVDRAEVLASPLWDERFYLSQFDFPHYTMDILPIDHYLGEGWKKGFNPSKYFDGANYARQYGLTEQNPLVYFLRTGRFRYKGFPKNTYLASDESIRQYWANKKKNRKVVYMCITGNYDNLEEMKGHYYINPEWDYVCFTDNQKWLKQKVMGIWQLRKLKYTKLDNTRNNRWHKVHPHLLFPEYTESIYMDSNVNVLTPYLYDEIKERNLDLLLPKHAGNFSIYHEYRWALEAKMDKPELIMKGCEEIMNTGFPFFYGMPECNVIYRRHASQLVKNIMTEWWSWIQNYAKRDQLSFSYLLWKYRLPVDAYTFANTRIDYKDFCVFCHVQGRKENLKDA
ncbi:MAG: glycosyltransferase [Pseudomonadota bacterium]|nr:glycosyltransferase [Pseudomonadota bacterium]